MDAKTDLPNKNPEQRRPWRELLPVHPAALLFPLMTEAELQELAADIEKNGLREPVALYHDPELGECLFDGRNRCDALELLGRKVCGDNGRLIADYEWPLDRVGYAGPRDPYAYVVSRNLRRRHLNAEQRRDVIAKLLASAPERSNRQVATLAGVDHKTVAAVRAEGEATGEIPQLEKTKGKDGKERPARRPRPAATSADDQKIRTAPRTTFSHREIKIKVLREAVRICADRCRRLP